MSQVESEFPPQTLIDQPKGQAYSLVYAWYVVFVLMLASTFSFLDRMIMGLLVGPIRESFQISDTQYSLLAGLAFAIFYTLMGFPLARIADRKSRRNLIALGIAVWSLMTAICGLTRGFWGLFLARIGVGVGEASLGPAAISMITDYFPVRLLGRALSVFALGIVIGSGLAYILGGSVVGLVSSMGQIQIPLLGEVQGWQLTFFIVGLPGLLVAAIMFTVKEPLRRGLMGSRNKDVGKADGSLSQADGSQSQADGSQSQADGSQSQADGSQSQKDDSLPLKEVIHFLWQRRNAYLPHMVGLSVFVIVLYGVNLWGPTYLIRVFGYSIADAGLTFGLIIAIAGTLGLLTGGYLADFWMRKGRADAYSRVILLSVLMTFPFVALLGIASTHYWGITLLCVALFFGSFQGGIAGGTLQLMTPNQMRAQVMAVYLFIANLVGLGFGPTLVAAVTDYVFADDGAIGSSLALCGFVLCPISAIILFSGKKSITSLIADNQGRIHPEA